MSSEEISIPITPEVPGKRKHNWYILIYSIKEESETKNEMINTLKDVPFIILGSDKVRWLENVEFLIVPDEGLYRVRDMLEISGVSRIPPIQVSIDTVSSNFRELMIDDFYKRKGLPEVETDIENNLKSLEEAIVERRVDKGELSGIERKIREFKANVDRLEEYDCTEHQRYTKSKREIGNIFWERYSRVVAQSSRRRITETGP